MKISKSVCCPVTGCIIFVVVILLGFIFHTEIEWCEVIESLGHCELFKDDHGSICYCIDEDSDHPRNQEVGIYRHAESRCTERKGNLAVIDNGPLLLSLSKRLYKLGIDDAMVALRKLGDQWYWMTPEGQVTTTDLLWRGNVTLSPKHTYATINVGTFKAEADNEEEYFVYYNYDYYLEKDRTTAPGPLLFEKTEKNTTMELIQENGVQDECVCSSNDKISLPALGESQFFTSPRYPKNYCSDLNCRWMVCTIDGLAIKFETIVFNIEKKFDYLYVYDGVSSTEDPLIASCTGSFCSDLISSANEMQIHFSADHVTTDLGFKIQVTAVETDPCFCSSLVLVVLPNLGDSFSLYSPRYPESYCENHDCHWSISAPDKYGLQVVWDSFAIEDGKDFVAILEGNSARTDSVGNCTGHFCDNVITSTEDLHIHFRSDEHQSTDDRFTAVITVVQNFCDKINSSFGSMSYSSERSDQKIPTAATATLTCKHASKLMGTTKTLTDTVKCQGPRYERDIATCVPVCKINKVAILTHEPNKYHVCTMKVNTDLELVESGHSIQVHYHNALTGHKESTETFECNSNSKWTPHQPTCHSPFVGILLIGGEYWTDRYNWEEKQPGHMELYSPFESNTQDVGFKLIENRVFHSTIVLENGTILVIGGLSVIESPIIEDGSAVYPKSPSFNSTELIEPYTRTVTPGPRLIQSRASAGAALFKGQPVVCGGTEEPSGRVLASCEVLDLARNQWTTIPRMLLERRSPALVAFGDYLYAIGGGQAQGGFNSDTVEKFTESTQTWQQQVARMNYGHQWHPAVVFHGNMITCGARDPGVYMLHLFCERYNTKENRWEFIATLKNDLEYHAMAVWGGRLYVIGGKAYQEPTDSVEVYDEKPVYDDWDLVHKKIKHGRYGHSAIAFPYVLS